MAELKKKNFLKLRRASPDHCILFRQTDTLNRSAHDPNTEKDDTESRVCWMVFLTLKSERESGQENVGWRYLMEIYGGEVE